MKKATLEAKRTRHSRAWVQDDPTRYRIQMQSSSSEIIILGGWKVGGIWHQDQTPLATKSLDFTTPIPFLPFSLCHFGKHLLLPPPPKKKKRLLPFSLYPFHKTALPKLSHSLYHFNKTPHTPRPTTYPLPFFSLCNHVKHILLFSLRQLLKYDKFDNFFMLGGEGRYHGYKYSDPNYCTTTPIYKMISFNVMILLAIN